MPPVDYTTTGIVDVHSGKELVSLFQERKGHQVRLIGRGTRQAALPAPTRPVLLVRTAAMDRILRLEADDMTCTVEPGLPLGELQGALQKRGLVLPGLAENDDATTGGLFAVGELGPAAPGALAVRSLLLGLEGVLSEGLAFASGARVVKSVAGFDLQKLFVGSRGRLFAVTALHLKLRPLPRASVDFVLADLEREQAVAHFRNLRLLAAPPTRLALWSQTGRHAVGGRFEGTARQVRASMASTNGIEGTTVPSHLVAPPGYETVVGHLRPSRLTTLLELLDRSGEVPFLIHGTGRFEAALPAPEVDRLLLGLPDDTCCAIRTGTPERRGRSTPNDPVVARLEEDLKRALDRDDVLC